MSAIRIQEMPESEKGRFYIFADVAELFWPGDCGYSNHTAEERVRERMEQMGCKRLEGYWDYQTPTGKVAFDSESGAFECHAPFRDPVEYVKEVIEMLLAEREAHREALQ